MHRPLDVHRWDATAILDALPDGAYITDTDRRILFWNRAAESITGWTRADVLGRNCRDNILVHEDKDGHPLCGHEHCPLHRAIVSGEASDVGRLVFAQTKEGRRVAVDVTVAPLRDGDGEVSGGIEVFRDLSPTMEDLNRARAIQRAALTASLPRDERVDIGVCFTPHDLVGGDLYRAEAIDADRYALLVADVTGHGIAAALYTMQLRSLWDEGHALLGRPAEFLKFLNHRLGSLMSGGGDYFATAALACYEADSGLCRIACAGHPPPLLLRPDGTCAIMKAAGPALGMLPDADYVEHTERLAPRDAMLLYSDGAFEIPDASGTELGPDGLRRLIATLSWDGVDAALERLEEALLVHAGTPFLPDDLTLLAARRVPAALRD